jgi:hypothetical protein
MNTFASLLQQRKSKNNLMGWLNKPAFHQLGANLAPIQKFVLRTTKGSHNPFNFGAYQASDDQTVDTTTTWEDKIRTQEQHEEPPRIKQTVVFVNRGHLPACTASSSSDDAITEGKVMKKRQRKSQQKNKVLMLLQLEQVAAERKSLREGWRILREEFFLEVFRSRILHRRTIRLRKFREIDERIQNQRRVIAKKPLLDLEEYYRKFDSCLEELHDRNEIMELEAFKQLVIREIEERAEAQKVYREHLKVVHGQLMQKFIVDELIQGGLYSGPARRRPRETLDEWIHISDDIQDQRNTIPQNPGEGSEWVVCDF